MLARFNSGLGTPRWRFFFTALPHRLAALRIEHPNIDLIGRHGSSKYRGKVAERFIRRYRAPPLPNDGRNRESAIAELITRLL